MVRVPILLQSWLDVREDVAQAVEDMPAGALDFRPQEDLMSFREVAEHILDVSHWIPRLLLEGERDFSRPEARVTRQRYRIELAAGAPAAELAATLRNTLAEDVRLLESQSPEFFASSVKRWDGQELTALEMLCFAKEHELSHRMQLFLYLRMNGVVPPTTRRKLTGR